MINPLFLNVFVLLSIETFIIRCQRAALIFVIGEILERQAVLIKLKHRYEKLLRPHCPYFYFSIFNV